MLYYFACNHPDDNNCSFYKEHGDFIKADVSKNQGPRYLTAFLYLNDVEKGGETVFRAGVSVTPKAGRLVLWPSVLDHDPDKENVNSHHEARPVLQGEKYGVNFWLHKFPFRTPHSKGCTMWSLIIFKVVCFWTNNEMFIFRLCISRTIMLSDFILHFGGKCVTC